MTYGTARNAGVDEETAQAIGGMAGGIGRMAGGHQRAHEQGRTHPSSATAGDPGYHQR
jgi:hypothetical protein